MLPANGTVARIQLLSCLCTLTPALSMLQLSRNINILSVHVLLNHFYQFSWQYLLCLSIAHAFLSFCAAAAAAFRAVLFTGKQWLYKTIFSQLSFCISHCYASHQSFASTSNATVRFFIINIMQSSFSLFFVFWSCSCCWLDPSTLSVSLYHIFFFITRPYFF